VEEKQINRQGRLQASEIGKKDNQSTEKGRHAQGKCWCKKSKKPEQKPQSRRY
jgi:hypothetical protein